MKNFEFAQFEKEKPEVKEFGVFDINYFKELEGEDGWLALGDDNYSNQHYFTVYGDNHEKIGIIGVFDTSEETHRC